MKRKWIYFLIFTVSVFVVHNLLAIKFLTVFKNEGISFGQDIPRLVFLVGFVLVFGLLFLQKKWSLGLVLIIGGGFSNLIERIIYGYVRDYWYLGFNVYNNLNDWLIGLGVLLFLIEVIWKKESK